MIPKSCRLFGQDHAPKSMRCEHDAILLNRIMLWPRTLRGTRKPGRRTRPPPKRRGARVTTERQRAANRRNARSSTGPRTAAGKARVAQNAVRHGLNVAIADDPL